MCLERSSDRQSATNDGYKLIDSVLFSYLVIQKIPKRHIRRSPKVSVQQIVIGDNIRTVF